MAVGGHMEEDAQASLDATLARCRESPECRARYPDLEGAVAALLARLARAPARVAVRDPLTAAPSERTFDADDLRRLLVAFSYQAETAALLPPLLAAAARGDAAPAAQALEIVSGAFEDAVARPLQLSVLCAEDVPFIRDGAPEADGARYLGGEVRAQFRRLCAEWPVPAVPEAWRAPVRARVPALVLSGGADPVTPPRWGELAAANLDGARHVVLPGQGHGVFVRGCLPRLAARFVEEGSAAALDLACAARSVPAPLFLDAMGGAP
jgi:pimeloyl-ACP methyl ester carboxylesterase